MVELSTLGKFSTVARVATRRVARSKVVGQMVRTDNDRFMFRLAQGNLLRANTVSTVAKVDLSSHALSSFRVRTVAIAMNATGGVQITPHRTHACALSFSLRAGHRTIHSNAPAFCSKIIPSLTMSLLGAPEFSAFPSVLTSSTTTPTRLTGISLNPCATPLWCGQSGHLADPTPNTRWTHPKSILKESMRKKY